MRVLCKKRLFLSVGQFGRKAVSKFMSGSVVRSTGSMFVHFLNLSFGQWMESLYLTAGIFPRRSATY